MPEIINSHNPMVVHVGDNMMGTPAHNITFDYKGYALSFWTGIPAELLVFQRIKGEDSKDVTALFTKKDSYLHATAEGLRDVMNLIDIQ